MINPAHQREKPSVVAGFTGSKCHRAHGAAMKTAEETDELRALGVIPGKFNCCFHAFGARIGHKTDRILLERSNPVKVFPKFHPFRMIKIRGNMNKFFCLLLDGFDHPGMAVTGGNHRDSCRKIQKAVPVHIPDFDAPAMIHDKGVTAGIRR